MTVPGDGARHDDKRPRFLRRVVGRVTAVGFEHRRISDVRYDVDTAHERLNSQQVRLDDHHTRLRRIDTGERTPDGVVLAQIVAEIRAIREQQVEHFREAQAQRHEFRGLIDDLAESMNQVSHAARRFSEGLGDT